ncbi:MAG: hypothetical protein K2J20_03205, partial [Bacilli bacterium]|nr:hypothetical protein [Bacilli bacterium]
YYDPAGKNEEFTYYQKTYKSIENGYAFSYQADIPYQEFNRARTLKTVFATGGIGYLEEEGYYYISVSNSNIFKYNEELDSIKINISLKNAEVLSNNAARRNGNTYTWYMTKDSNTTINIKYKLRNTSTPTNPSNPETPTNPSSPDNNKKNENTSTKNHLFDYILAGSALLLFIIGIIGLIKYKSIRK